MKRNILFIFLMFVLILVFSVNLHGRSKESMVGKTAPEINAKAWINSDPLTIEGLKGKIVVVEFWATWCPPCKKSIPHLIDIYKKYSKKGIEFISLTGEKYELVQSFSQEMKMVYPVGTGSTSAKDYGVTGIPHAVIIDSNGIIQWEGHPMDQLGKRIDEIMNKMETMEKIDNSSLSSEKTGEIKLKPEKPVREKDEHEENN